MMTTGLDEYSKCWECGIADGTVGPCHWCGRPICLEHDNQPRRLLPVPLLRMHGENASSCDTRWNPNDLPPKVHPSDTIDTENHRYSWAVDLGPFKLGRIARQ